MNRKQKHRFVTKTPRAHTTLLIRCRRAQKKVAATKTHTGKSTCVAKAQSHCLYLGKNPVPNQKVFDVKLVYRHTIPQHPDTLQNPLLVRGIAYSGTTKIEDGECVMCGQEGRGVPLWTMLAPSTINTSTRFQHRAVGLKKDTTTACGERDQQRCA